MTSPKATARLAGIIYLIMSALMIFGYMYVPGQFGGDAATVARKITERETFYRFSILAAFVGQILFLYLVVTLYQLFRDVDRWQARLMLVLVCAAVTAELTVIANKMAPLIYLGGSDYLAVFTRPQLEALAQASTKVGTNLARMLVMFWGLWLIPFGILTIKSGYFPKVLGYLLFASGLGYIATALAFLVAPAQLGLVTRIVSPLYFGELAMVLWLPIMGAREPRAVAG